MIKNTFIYAAAGIVSQAFSYLTLPLLVKCLSQAEFGEVALIETSIPLLVVIVTVAVERAAQRYYFDTRFYERKVFANASAWILTHGTVLLLLSIFFQSMGLVGNYYSNYSLSMMIFAAMGTSIGGLALVHAQVTFKPWIYFCMSFAKGILQLFTVYYLVKHCRLGVEGFLFGTVLSCITLGGIGFCILPKFSLNQIDVKLTKEMLSFSAPLILTILSAWLLNMQGRFFLATYSGVEQVGLYAFYFKISFLYLFCAAAINTAISPVILQILSSGVTVNVIAQDMMIPLVRVYALAAFAIVLCSKEISYLLGTESYHIPQAIFSIIIAGHFLASVMGASSDLILSFYKKTRAQSAIFVCGGISSTCLNFLITPSLGILGTVISAVAGLLLIITGHFLVLSNKGYPLSCLIEILLWGSAICIMGNMLAQLDFGSQATKFGEVAMRYLFVAGIVVYTLYLLVQVSKKQEDRILG